MNNALQFVDTNELYDRITEKLDDIDDGTISAVVDLNTAVDILTCALVDEYHPFIVDIDSEEYDDAYIVTLSNFNGYEVSVEKALCCGGYVTGAETMYIDCSLPTYNDYMVEIKNHPFYYPEGTTLFFIGKNKNTVNKTYDYHNKFEDKNRFAEFTISSNVKDFVDVLHRFF